MRQVWFDSLIHLQDSQTGISVNDTLEMFDSLIHLQDSQTVRLFGCVSVSLIHLFTYKTLKRMVASQDFADV